MCIRDRARKGSIGEHIMDWRDWFKEQEFYYFAIVYMCARITVNVCSSMLQFYLVNVLRIATTSVQEATPLELALIPITLFTFSVAGSITLDVIQKRVDKKTCYTIGLIFVIFSAALLMILDHQYKNWVYLAAITLGFGQSVCLNTALNYISDVIGLRGSSGAFVFGAYSFTDKFANGIILYFAMASDSFRDKDEGFLRIMTAVVPAVASAVGWALILIAGKKVTPEQSSKNSIAKHL
eukprot:TRINITY_DN10760_c0_g1_i2.p1 TRINITY_DN10760_c0_g1~~TRINITY_DN10760_c0_g1_i2.p1  ORF type:complete len:238 (+),score=38.60 TRINITY_DN10760_c0_g1_i2:65-778(+)